MIVSRIYGGIGNQLFQYSFGLSQAKRLKTELLLDTYILDKNPFNYTPYKCELFNFEGIDEEAVSNKDYPGLKLIEEDKLKNIHAIQDGSLLDGYWQNEQYFENIKDELRKKIKVKKEISIKTVEYRDRGIGFPNENTISIHVRRGDYLNGDYFVDLSKTDYYKKSVEKILQLIANDNSIIERPTFFIFSNDIKWASDYFKWLPGMNTSFINNNTINDLYLMSQCRCNITANSTYSWWAAWLNDNTNKIVIQPKNWYKNKCIESLKLQGSVVL
jgi:hypothetical protein